eukprot:scaffold468_cov154-Skeletonema_marinoi.AAC.3
MHNVTISAFCNIAACCFSRSTLYKHKGQAAYRKKERITRRPRNEDNLCKLPSSSRSSKSGASSPIPSSSFSSVAPFVGIVDVSNLKANGWGWRRRIVFMGSLVTVEWRVEGRWGVGKVQSKVEEQRRRSELSHAKGPTDPGPGYKFDRLVRSKSKELWFDFRHTL